MPLDVGGCLPGCESFMRHVSQIYTYLSLESISLPDDGAGGIHVLDDALADHGVGRADGSRIIVIRHGVSFL